ncbi:uncharacterized protein LOC119454127 [Dermacentor silvarum]|uniref:uncharacterized protein LOC119454127 n=1 Tax=Dermacentor silvarum TaxID=543639 RepID=UPI00189B79D5|nr:uncharacterized protein LOC119454127 [Dermacentor silvarum]
MLIPALFVVQIALWPSVLTTGQATHTHANGTTAVTSDDTTSDYKSAQTPITIDAPLQRSDHVTDAVTSTLSGTRQYINLTHDPNHFSGLGGTDQTTMLIPALFVVQIALWPSVLTTGQATHTHANGTTAVTSDDTTSDYKSAQTPITIDAPLQRSDHVTDAVTSTLSGTRQYINLTHDPNHFSGLGGTDQTTMLIPALFVVQVSNNYSVPSLRDNDVTLTVLPSPHFLAVLIVECYDVFKLLLLTSGDVELNPGPTSDSESDTRPNNDLLKQILKEQSKTNKTLKELVTNLKKVERTVDNMETRLAAIENDMERLKYCEEKLAECENKYDTTKDQIQNLALKLDDLENRSRRNNLIIYGVTEKPNEDIVSLEKIVRENILKETLGIEVKTLERIHRIGTRTSNRDRPIILRLFDYAEKTKILSCCYKLKGTPLTVSEDFSKRVREMRTHLWHSAVNERANGAKVRLTFDKLRIDEKVYTWDPVKNIRIELPQKASLSKHSLSTSTSLKSSKNKKVSK